MTLAPTHYMIAGLRVLFWATTMCRNMAVKGDVPYKRLEDLMDAVNHLPQWLENWEGFDEQRLRIHLATYDSKWAAVEPTFSLQAIFDQALERAARDGAV